MALETFVDGLAFAEGLRWRDGQLWFSDMHDHSVWRVGEDGTRHRVCDVAGRPSGLGWLPGGELLIVSMLDRKILKLCADGTLSDHADLSDLAPRRTNDMIVDAKGRAYVGNFGFDFDEDEAPATTTLALVMPDGEVSPAGNDLLFPNGMVITADGATLIVAETFASRLSAFDIDGAGKLSNKRVWAELADGAVPDGICIDAEDAVWVATPTTGDCLRAKEGGEVLA
ncbi:MAG: SMP-30/gluconolactonase/LRE family protein, partial [Parvibaculum sp.]|nr:SMP-30/gluconolactonase/LRE family protein [Parvibaculum sp.]